MKYVFLFAILMNFMNGFSQTEKEMKEFAANHLDKVNFSKMSIPENLTEQIVTKNVTTSWTLMKNNIIFTLNDGTTNIFGTYDVLNYTNDKENYSYTFLCKERFISNSYTGNYQPKDKSRLQKEIYIQYKYIDPKMIMVSDGTNSYTVHN